MNQQRLEKLKGLWPLGLCWLAMMLAGWGAMYYIERSFASNNVAQTAIVGLFFGQFGLAAIIGGLFGRTWLSGWILAVLLTWIAMALYLLAGLQSLAMDFGERLAIGALAPALTLAACAPLFLMRGLRGWSLTLSKQTAIIKERAGVEDLFLMSVAVACSLSLLRIVTVFTRGFETQAGMMMSATFFGFSLLFVVPATAVTFRARSWGQRWLGWTGIAAAAAIGCLAMSVTVEPTEQSMRWETLGYVALGVGSCALTMALGAWAILASGFQLTRFAPATTAATEQAQEDSVEDVQPGALNHTTRWQARWLTAGLILVTVFASGWLAYADHRQLEFFETLRQDFGEGGEYAGGTIALAGKKVVAVTVGRNTTDETLYRFKRFRDLERLSLAHSQITDRSVPEFANFPSLQALDLSDTAISDVGLEHVLQSTRVTELSIAKTRVSPSQAFKVAAAMHLSKLDVSGLDIDDDELQDACILQSVQKLALRDNPITDKGLAKLLQSAPISLSYLDLSNTSVDGSSLIAGPCPSVLLLDGTKITDANLIAILQGNPGISISIKNTAITAQVLRIAHSVQATLMLGGGEIKESDLVNLGRGGFGTLRLNGPEFTGECLAKLVPSQCVDVSYSGVTDAAFLELKQLDGVYLTSLNIAHTQLTDATLPVIDRMGCYELDLRDTKITADGLLRHRSRGTRIIVDFDQFTPAELASLHQRFEVAIGGKSMWWSADW